jgi:hypothetical protein
MKANMVASELRLGFTEGCHDRRNRDVKSYREGLAAMQESRLLRRLKPAAFAPPLDPASPSASEDAAPGQTTKPRLSTGLS